MKTREEIQDKINELMSGVRESTTAFPMDYTDFEKRSLSLIGALRARIEIQAQSEVTNWVCGTTDKLEV